MVRREGRMGRQDRQDPHDIDMSAMHPGQQAGTGRRGSRRPGRRPGGWGQTCNELGDCGECACALGECGSAFPFLLGAFALRAPRRAPRRRVSGPALAGVAAIRAYQRLLSPRLPIACRHTPSCSRYGIAAVRRYGLAHGVRLTAGRISRCTSAVPHGTADPVP
jgi:putative membrane protein insertion efficiency factor